MHVIQSRWLRVWCVIAIIALSARAGMANASRPVLITPVLPAASQWFEYQANVLIGGVPAPTSIILSGLPSGLRYSHNGSGSVAITGAPTVSGTADIAVEATNADGSAMLALKLKVVATIPAATGASGIAVGESHACAISRVACSAGAIIFTASLVMAAPRIAVFLWRYLRAVAV